MPMYILFGVVVIATMFVIFLVFFSEHLPFTRRQSNFTQSPEIRQEADKRAEQLLKLLLLPEQYNQLTRKGYIEVPSGLYPYRVYRIPRHRGSVEVYEMGRLVMSLCIQPTENVPDADVVVMHKLMIEGNEREYERRANRFDRQTDLFW